MSVGPRPNASRAATSAQIHDHVAVLALRERDALGALDGEDVVREAKNVLARRHVDPRQRCRADRTSVEVDRRFDESATPIVYPLAQLIRGWQIVFQLFPKGTSATLYVPSPLGYGASGYQPGIPPNANLIFDVELVDFKD